MPNIMRSNSRQNGLYLGCALVLLFFSSSSLAASVNALFEIALGQGETDAQLDIGENLDLELWMTLSSTDPIPDVIGLTFFLDVMAADNNIITFNNNFINDTPLEWTNVNGTDNSPVTGEFSRSYASFMGNSIPVQSNVATRIGRFSIQALNAGTVDYYFGNDGAFRICGAALQGTEEKPSVLPPPSTPAFNITIMPEPGSASGMILMLMCAHRRRKK